jgi:hypothetical protein
VKNLIDEIPEFTPESHWRVFEPVFGDLERYIRIDDYFWIERFDEKRYKLLVQASGDRESLEKIPLDLLDISQVHRRVGMYKHELPHWHCSQARVFSRSLISRRLAPLHDQYLCMTVEMDMTDRVATVSLVTKGQYAGRTCVGGDAVPKSDGSAHGNNY